MLGPLTISRDGVALALPASRKVRALLAYLALAPHAVSRSQLCELLWDVPNDPRGELRWCLSKLRSILDEPGRRRVDAQADAVRLDLADCFVDAIEIARATQERRRDADAATGCGRWPRCSTATSSTASRSTAARPSTAGSSAQRRRFRACHAALLEHLAASVPDDEAFGIWRHGSQLAPFDRRVHEMLLNALARRGRMREGEEHLARDGAAVRGRRARLRAACATRGGRRGRSGRCAARRSSSPPPRRRNRTAAPPSPSRRRRRASIAVMPFVERHAAHRRPRRAAPMASPTT